MLAGAPDEAAAAFAAYLDLDPADSMGAGTKLALLGATPRTAELAPAYVERLFDQYAPRFDKALVEGLGYSAPRHIRAALAATWPGRRYRRCLDLGCGTGLMGAAVRDIVVTLEGVDISAGMLAEAKRKTIYDRLHKADLTAALTRERGALDLILAADVLVYVGDLAPVLRAAAGALAAGGVLALTVQAEEAVDFMLGADQRFSHSPSYVTRCLIAAGLTVMGLTPGSFRREKNADVPGLLAIAAKD